MFLRRLAILLITVLVASSAIAADDNTWQIDNNHSAAQFAVRHLGLSTVRGQFSKMTGTVQYDSSNIAKTTIDASIEANSIDTRIEMRDRDLRGPNYFDVEKFPVLTFKSKRTEAAPAGHMKVTGDLTIKGVTREVVLDVDPPTVAAKDVRGTARIGTEATTKINRRDFGVGGNSAVASDEVTITIDLELVRHTAQ